MKQNLIMSCIAAACLFSAASAHTTPAHAHPKFARVESNITLIDDDGEKISVNWRVFDDGQGTGGLIYEGTITREGTGPKLVSLLTLGVQSIRNTVTVLDAVSDRGGVGFALAGESHPAVRSLPLTIAKTGTRVVEGREGVNHDGIGFIELSGKTCMLTVMTDRKRIGITPWAIGSGTPATSHDATPPPPDGGGEN